MRINLNYLWVLTFLLIGGKVLGLIEISWFWALLPGIFASMVGLLIILVIAATLYAKRKKIV